MDESRVVVRPSSISPEEALDARARAWAYVFASFERHQSKKGGPDTAPDDARKESNHVSRNSIIPG